jgi:hypothetical protein
MTLTDYFSSGDNFGLRYNVQVDIKEKSNSRVSLPITASLEK